MMEWCLSFNSSFLSPPVSHQMSTCSNLPGPYPTHTVPALTRLFKHRLSIQSRTKAPALLRLPVTLLPTVASPQHIAADYRAANREDIGRRAGLQHKRRFPNARAALP